MRLPGWSKLLLVLAAAGAVGVLLRFTVLRPDPVPVTVFRVSRGSVEETVANSKAGTVKARRRSKISPEVGGRVVFIGARAGQQVRRGEILLRINDSDLKASLALAKQELATSRATAREACFTAELAERDLKRTRDLKDERIVSAELLDRLESQRDSARARCDATGAAVERARAAIDLADANLRKAILRSPFDGVVADLRTEVGEWASPSPPALPIPPVYDIIDPTSIYISAPLDEVDAAKVAPGLPARVTLDPFPNRSFEGRVTRVAPYVQDVEQQNRTLEVEVDFKDPAFARALLPGTSSDVEVILRTAGNVLRIPTYALLEGDHVLMFDDGVLRDRKVTTGLRNWEYAEVKEGLKEGDRVVVSLDREEVKKGARAEVKSEQTESRTKSGLSK
jgi:HlyD family secretion protein